MANWQTISNLIYADLSAAAGLTALLSNGTDSIYPLFADAEEGDSFVTYYAKYEGNPSKDGLFNYQIIINSFAPTYNSAIAIADQVSTAILAATNKYMFLSGEPAFNDQNEFYITQMFNIKK